MFISSFHRFQEFQAYKISSKGRPSPLHVSAFKNFCSKIEGKSLRCTRCKQLVTPGSNICILSEMIFQHSKNEAFSRFQNVDWADSDHSGVCIPCPSNASKNEYEEVLEQNGSKYYIVKE